MVIGTFAASSLLILLFLLTSPCRRRLSLSHRLTATLMARIVPPHFPTVTSLNYNQHWLSAVLRLGWIFYLSSHRLSHLLLAIFSRCQLLKFCLHARIVFLSWQVTSKKVSNFVLTAAYSQINLPIYQVMVILYQCFAKFMQSPISLVDLKVLGPFDRTSVSSFTRSVFIGQRLKELLKLILCPDWI